jgi:hypothetical protein
VQLRGGRLTKGSWQPPAFFMVNRYTVTARIAKYVSDDGSHYLDRSNTKIGDVYEVFPDQQRNSRKLYSPKLGKHVIVREILCSNGSWLPIDLLEVLYN